MYYKLYLNSNHEAYISFKNIFDTEKTLFILAIKRSLNTLIIIIREVNYGSWFTKQEKYLPPYILLRSVIKL